MRVEGELRRLIINKINSIMSNELETLPPKQEIILEISLDNKRLALLAKYSDISSRNTNACLYIFKNHCDDWVKDEEIFLENRTILSICMNDLGDKIAISIQDLGVKFMNYDYNTNKWRVKDSFLTTENTDKKDMFGHEIIYDRKDNLLAATITHATMKRLMS